MSTPKLPWLTGDDAPSSTPANPTGPVPVGQAVVQPAAGYPAAGYPAAYPAAVPEAASPYPAAPYPTAQYPAAQYPTGQVGYPAAAAPAAPYPGGQYPNPYASVQPATPQYPAAPQYPVAPQHPAAPQYPAAQQYSGPQYANPQYGSPQYGSPAYPGAASQYPGAQPVAAQPFAQAASPYSSAIPVSPAPVMPAPVMPAAVSPTPVNPALGNFGGPRPVVPVAPAVPVTSPTAYAQPTPIQPTPVQPAAVQPTPVKVAPVKVAPVQPTAVQASPAQAAPVQATPVKSAAVSAAVTPVAVTPVAVTPVAATPVAATVAGAVRPGAPRPVIVTPVAAPVVAVHDEEEESVEEKLIHESPAFIISAIINASILVILAIFGIYSMPKKSLEIEAVIWAEEIGVQLEEEHLTTGLMQEVEVAEPVLSKDQIVANDPFAAPPEVEVVLDGFQATSNIEAPSIGMALTGREKGMKEALLGKYGGTATTEAAVRAGLEWLKRNQEASGSWSLTGPYAGGGGIENRCAATAMALLAFQGAGHTTKQGEFQKEVTKGWAALLKMQDKDGLFYHEGAHHQALYAQGQATIAICELYGMTKDPEYKKPAQRAIDYAVKIQSPEGGWRYIPGQDSDTSVTGWYVMALQSALMAGLEVPSPTLERISKFLDSVQTDDGARYGYRPLQGSTETMTAEGLLCRQYLGWSHSDPRLASGVEYLLENPIRWDYENQNVYYWYYATQVTHHMEGEPWKKWNNVMRQVIPQNQTKTGKEAGSWAPDNDRWGNHGGRLFETCLCIYMLEVYYRHLPIYQWRAAK